MEAKMTTDITLFRFTDAFNVTEHILRQQAVFFEEIKAGHNLAAKIRDMSISAALFLALYGAVMGSSNSIQQAVSSAVKLPILFLITLLICLPTLYFFNLLFGSRLTLAQTLALVLTAITTTAVLTLSFAPIAIFFWLTAPNYAFFLLLNVIVLSLTGVCGLVFLVRGMTIAQQEESQRPGCSPVLWGWIAIYSFVGTQMAWTLRPFFGAPDLPFRFIGAPGGNFYVSVANLIWNLLSSGL